jgi:ribose transport system permease protein
MTRLVGVLLMVVILYTVLMSAFPTAFTKANHLELAGRLGYYGILTLGVGVLIISGGIDLSIGSLVGLGAVSYGLLLLKDWSPVPASFVPALAAVVVIGGSAFVGLFHGLLVTKLRLQPFLVTLCGLFIYRGLARGLTSNDVNLPASTEPFRKLFVSGSFLGVSHQLILLLVIASVLGLMLHRSVYGRYLYAIGHNEQAARYAGVFTDRYKIFAYILCSTLAGLGGVLFLLGYRNATPSGAGSLLELYAITGAVLGGCSLKGGEGTILGMFLGAAVLPLLKQICNLSPMGSEMEYTVIGGALLLGTIGNELLAGRKSR